MKLKDIIKTYNNLNVDIGSVEIRFVLKYNKSLMEPIVNTFTQIYNETTSDINNKELESLLNRQIDIPLIYITIEDIPEDIGILTKNEMDAIFSLVK